MAVPLGYSFQLVEFLRQNLNLEGTVVKERIATSTCEANAV